MSAEEERDPLELPTEKLRDDAFKLLGETKELRSQTIEEVRLALNEMDCGDFDKSDANIVRYLRGKKFDVEKTLKCITNRVAFCKEHPKWTANLSVKEFEAFFEFLTILPQRDKEGRVVLLARPGLFLKMCTKEFMRDYPFAMIRFNVWLFEELTLHPEINLYGAVFVLTAKDLSVWDSSTFHAVAKVDERIGFLKYLFSCTPMRVGGLYIFDEPFYVRWLFNIVSMFVSSKIKDRLHISSNHYSVLQSVVNDAYALPKCLGGNQDIDCQGPHNEWMRKLYFPNNATVETTNSVASSDDVVDK